jgi:NAD(P)-dependent dehydrogenase (short-subunit alcohol dehydrogenase family)
MTIIGGTTGIRLATAVLLSQLGTNIFIVGQPDEQLNSKLQQVNEKSTPGNLQGVVANLSTKDGVTKLFAEIDQRFSQLDVFINNPALAVEGVDKGTCTYATS